MTELRHTAANHKGRFIEKAVSVDNIRLTAFFPASRFNGGQNLSGEVYSVHRYAVRNFRFCGFRLRFRWFRRLLRWRAVVRVRPHIPFQFLNGVAPVHAVALMAFPPFAAKVPDNAVSLHIIQSDSTRFFRRTSVLGHNRVYDCVIHVLLRSVKDKLTALCRVGNIWRRRNKLLRNTENLVKVLAADGDFVPPLFGRFVRFLVIKYFRFRFLLFSLIRSLALPHIRVVWRRKFHIGGDFPFIRVIRIQLPLFGSVLQTGVALPLLFSPLFPLLIVEPFPAALPCFRFVIRVSPLTLLLPFLPLLLTSRFLLRVLLLVLCLVLFPFFGVLFALFVLVFQLWAWSLIVRFRVFEHFLVFRQDVFHVFGGDVLRSLPIRSEKRMPVVRRAHRELHRYLSLFAEHVTRLQNIRLKLAHEEVVNGNYGDFIHAYHSLGNSSSVICSHICSNIESAAFSASVPFSCK